MLRRTSDYRCSFCHSLIDHILLRELLDGLRDADFLLDDGPDGFGFTGLLWERGGGYYFG
jgi:hypothetical protein